MKRLPQVHSKRQIHRQTTKVDPLPATEPSSAGLARRVRQPGELWGRIVGVPVLFGFELWVSRFRYPGFAIDQNLLGDTVRRLSRWNILGASNSAQIHAFEQLR